MSLPTNDEYVETIFKLQKFVAVAGHAQQVGLPRGAEAYRFNIKLELDEDTMSDELFQKFTLECFEKSVAEAKKIWPWVDDIKRAGRNNGWAIVIKKDQAGVNEWNNDYRKLQEDNGDEDVRSLYWMLIQRRLEDLEAMQEFVQDEIKTHQRYAKEWLLKVAPNTPNTASAGDEEDNTP